MDPMMKRWMVWTGWIALAVTSACAQGSPAEPVNAIEATAAVLPPPCGNGKPDLNEECDCGPNVSTGSCKVDTMTCEVARPGSKGMLLCDSVSCKFDVTYCTGGTAGPKTTGGAGSGR